MFGLNVNTKQKDDHWSWKLESKHFVCTQCAHTHNKKDSPFSDSIYFISRGWVSHSVDLLPSPPFLTSVNQEVSFKCIRHAATEERNLKKNKGRMT